ncbi:MAG: HAD family phosphatase [Chitinophagaceae bacterium]
MQKIKNLLLDLGGVVLDIHFSKTKKAFEDLGVTDFDTFFSQYHASPLFENLETGKIKPTDFYEAFRRETKLSTEDAAIIEAWNALIGEFPKERMEFIKSLSSKYTIFLLSNTNIIHYDAFIKKFLDEYNYDFNTLFSNAYYSHEINLRKPYAEAFEYVLEKENLNPAETLFIDDTKTNTDAAERLGMQTILLVPPRSIMDLDL